MTLAWWQCPARACAHSAVLHDGDGIDEDYMCNAFGCECRSRLDEHGRVSVVQFRGSGGQPGTGSSGTPVGSVSL